MASVDLKTIVKRSKNLATRQLRCQTCYQTAAHYESFVPVYSNVLVAEPDHDSRMKTQAPLPRKNHHLMTSSLMRRICHRSRRMLHISPYRALTKCRLASTTVPARSSH